MSPLWRDEIGVYVSPHKLALTRQKRGVRPRSVREFGWSNGFLGDTQWNAVLAALDVLLAKPEWQKAVARLVIGDHWVRYACVPYSAALTGEAERLSHARHVLTNIYGEVVSQWTISLSDSPPGNSVVACAMPTGLIEELQVILRRHAIPLASLQPQLVCAYNHWRGRLPDNQGWFVSVDQGSLAAARVGARGWDYVHSVRIGADWAVELQRLQTFGRLASAQPQEGRVYIDAPPALRAAAGAGGSGLVWLEEERAESGTAGQLEFVRRHQA